MQEAQSLGDSLLASFQDKAPGAQTAGACAIASQDNEETPAQAMQRLRDVQAPGPKVLVVCGHSDADLASEMTHVSQYSQALREAFGSHVMAYVSEMSAEVSPYKLLDSGLWHTSFCIQDSTLSASGRVTLASQFGHAVQQAHAQQGVAQASLHLHVGLSTVCLKRKEKKRLRLSASV